MCVHVRDPFEVGKCPLVCMCTLWSVWGVCVCVPKCMSNTEELSVLQNKKTASIKLAINVGHLSTAQSGSGALVMGEVCDKEEGDRD